MVAIVFKLIASGDDALIPGAPSRVVALHGMALVVAVHSSTLKELLVLAQVLLVPFLFTLSDDLVHLHQPFHQLQVLLIALCAFILHYLLLVQGNPHFDLVFQSLIRELDLFHPGDLVLQLLLNEADLVPIVQLIERVIIILLELLQLIKEQEVLLVMSFHQLLPGLLGVLELF